MSRLITSLVYESASSSMDCIITIIRQVTHLADNVCGHVILPSLHVMWITCSRYGHLDVVRYLVTEVHCDPNSKSTSGETPLHYACWWAECCSGGVSALPVFSWLSSCGSYIVCWYTVRMILLPAVGLVTLGAHAQRGYSSWVCVSVCYSTSHFSNVPFIYSCRRRDLCSYSKSWSIG